MKRKQLALLYISSEMIKEFASRHPVMWPDRDLANGPGNKMTPTPAMGVFFEYLDQNGDLFTQDEYANYAWLEWSDWRDGLTERVIEGVTARLKRNFYISGLDTLYVWSLLVETGLFSRCLIDVIEDTVGKTDISVWTKGGGRIPIALHAGNRYAQAWTSYKRDHRGNTEESLVDVELAMERDRSPGNKRWYNLDDLGKVVRRAKRDTARHRQVKLGIIWD